MNLCNIYLLTTVPWCIHLENLRPSSCLEHQIAEEVKKEAIKPTNEPKAPMGLLQLIPYNISIPLKWNFFVSKLSIKNQNSKTLLVVNALTSYQVLKGIQVKNSFYNVSSHTIVMRWKINNSTVTWKHC